MSTYWNIECRRCGLEVITDVYGWTNHHGESFSELCASGLLLTKPLRTSSWTLTIINDFDMKIELDRLHDTECPHDFEPRNEYGEWAKPEMWPDGHPKSRVTIASATPDCSGLGDVRCIG